jgi:hypothetical protein
MKQTGNDHVYVIDTTRVNKHPGDLQWVVDIRLPVAALSRLMFVFISCETRRR